MHCHRLAAAIEKLLVSEIYSGNDFLMVVSRNRVLVLPFPCKILEEEGVPLQSPGCPTNLLKKESPDPMNT